MIGIDVAIDEAADGPRQAARCSDEDNPLAERTPGDVEKAVRKLSTHATVVAIAFQRTKTAIAGRNESMRTLCKVGVSFATPISLVDPGDHHYRFLRDRRHAVTVYGLTQYPSLGTLWQRQRKVLSVTRISGRIRPRPTSARP